MADDRDPEDYIVLGTVRSPGVVRFPGLGKEKRWNVKSAKGQQGASMTLDGDDPGTVTAEFYLTDTRPEDGGPTDVELWEDFHKLIESTTPIGGKPTALPVSNPDCARHRFTAFTNGGISGPVYDGRGGRTMTVKFREYVPPKPKPVAKAAAKPAQTYATTDEGRRSPPPDDPNAAAKRELAELTDQARRP
jgi:hypothetical protein